MIKTGVIIVYLGLSGLMLAGPAHATGLPPCKGPIVWTAPQTSGPLTAAWPLRKPDRKLWQVEGAVAESGGVVVTFPKGSINPSHKSAPRGGLGFSDYRPEQWSGCLTYEIRFQPGFFFNKGGKLPGLFGGSDYSGCTTATGSGFSTRMMWGKDGTFFLYGYLADRTSDCGEVQGSGVVNAMPGHWHRIEQRIRLNAPGQSNGDLSVLVDGQLIADLRDREITPGIPIEGLAFHTFFGGNAEAWASPKTQKIGFRAFRFVLP